MCYYNPCLTEILLNVVVKISFGPVGKGLRPTPRALENLVICVRVFCKHAIKSVSTETSKVRLTVNLFHGQMDPQGFLAV